MEGASPSAAQFAVLRPRPLFDPKQRLAECTRHMDTQGHGLGLWPALYAKPCFSEAKNSSKVVWVCQTLWVCCWLTGHLVQIISKGSFLRTRHCHALAECHSEAAAL